MFTKMFYKFFTASVLLAALMSCQKMERPILGNYPKDSDSIGGVTKVLAIGNSFSEDAIETYLYELAKADGRYMIIGNMYIGGASLDLHMQNAQNNANAYDYRKIDEFGNKKSTANTSIAYAVADEKWDYISFQQVSQNSGQFETYQVPLPFVFDYVDKRKRNKDVKYILHQTWAYAQSSTHSGFANYGKDQMTMYNAIIDAVNKAKKLVNISLVVPSGTAIQNARTSVVGDNFTRDGYHLSIPMGRYVAACTWYETLFKKSVVGNKFKPAGLSDFEAAICQNAAHMAVQQPDAVTEMLDFQKGDGSVEGGIFINLGNSTVPENWNGLTGFTSGSSVSLKNAKGNYTGITATVLDRFNGQNNDGAKITTTDMNMPESVSGNSFFGNAKASFGGMIIQKSTIKIKGLNKNEKYNFCYFGSRMNVSDNRDTKFITTGKNEVITSLNTSNNTNKTACAEGVQPNDAGEIIITVTIGDNNTNGTGFYYLGSMRISK